MKILGFLARGVRRRHAFRIGETLRNYQQMEITAELMSGLVHDFNKLLVIIKANCELLLENDLPPHVEASVQRMRKAAGQGSRFSEKLLTLTRGESPKKDVINIDSALREMDILLRFALRPNMELELDLNAQSAQTAINQVCLQQVVLNLVLNSRDAVADDGAIAVRTGTLSLSDKSAITSALPPGKYTVLEVCDNGCGIGSNAEVHTYRPFFSAKQENQANGLGLTIVNRIVSLNGGEMQVASAPGMGNAARVLLPDISRNLDAESGNTRPLTEAVNDRKAHIPVLWSPTSLVSAGFSVVRPQGFCQ